jgi:hypothetical protein
MTEAVVPTNLASCRWLRFASSVPRDRASSLAVPPHPRPSPEGEGRKGPLRKLMQRCYGLDWTSDMSAKAVPYCWW